MNYLTNKSCSVHCPAPQQGAPNGQAVAPPVIADHILGPEMPDQPGQVSYPETAKTGYIAFISICQRIPCQHFSQDM